MLSKQQMMKAALNECVSMLGEDLVEKHKDLCCSSCNILDNGSLAYSLGMDTKEKPYQMGKETAMEYYAFVVVNPETGGVMRDYEKSTLPS